MIDWCSTKQLCWTTMLKYDMDLFIVENYIVPVRCYLHQTHVVQRYFKITISCQPDLSSSIHIFMCVAQLGFFFLTSHWTIIRKIYRVKLVIENWHDIATCALKRELLPVSGGPNEKSRQVQAQDVKKMAGNKLKEATNTFS